jgi:hypothetical protein
MMKNVILGMAAALGVLVALVIIFGVMWMSAVNAEARARNAFNAQAKVNESSFDKMWKVIKGQAEVSETERESFRKTYTEIMNSTKGVAGQGQLASFFTQAKIDVSPELYSKLMTSIEAQRGSFHRDQQHLLKLKQQHDNIRTTMPSSFFVGSKPELEVKIVTSGKTQEAFSTGEDNDSGVFSK